MKTTSILIGLTGLAFLAVESPSLAAEKGRPDAVRYSYTIWSRGTLHMNETRSAKTPYGTLTCTGGKGFRGEGSRISAASEAPRSCHWGS